MVAAPKVQRTGDSWALAWEEQSVGMGFEYLKEVSDGLKAEVTVESGVAGRVLGPVSLNLLSSRSQTEFANRCAKRVNSLPADMWDAIVVSACAVVARQFRAPSPTIKLNTVSNLGPVEFLDRTGLIPLGETTFIYGDGESLKSMMAMRIAISVTLGLPLPWGPIPTRKMKVLLCDWETNDHTQALRLQRLCLGIDEVQEVPEVLYRGTLRDRQSPPLRYLEDEVPSLREQIQREEIGLVLIDSLSFAVRGKLVDDDVARQAIFDLRQLSPATRLVVAHISKESAEKPGGRVDPFGSRFFRNGLRSGFEMRKTEEQTVSHEVDLGIYQHKNNDMDHVKPFGLRASFDGTDGPITFSPLDLHQNHDLLARTPLSQRIRDLLKHGDMTVEALADELDAKEGSIRNTLRRMPDTTQLNPGGGAGKRTTWGLSAQLV